MNLRFEARTLPFQTIIGHNGSEQKTHSDPIHMSTSPRGFRRPTGSPRRDRRLSRKALVCHYFTEGCIRYHDYTGNLSGLDLSKPAAAGNFDSAAALTANRTSPQPGWMRTAIVRIVGLPRNGACVPTQDRRRFTGHLEIPETAG